MCTANMCRSAMAEGLLKAKLEALCVRADVSSAGSMDGGRPAAPGAVATMAERQIDISSHRSRQLAAAMLARADLVIGMAREHVREAVLLDPDSWPKVFTLRELVRRAQQMGPRVPGQPMPAWLAKVHVGRERTELLGASAIDDVADPIGGPATAFELTAAELSALVDCFVNLVWGAA